MILDNEKLKNNCKKMEISEKITLEKRKRHQIYTTLNYLRSHKNKFDFFLQTL